MSNEALHLIHEGMKALDANRREETWREIYGPPVLPEDLANRPLGSLQESRRKGTIASVMREMEEEGLAISPVELARLVDVRLRRSPSNKNEKPDHKTIAAEIEATLDLVEHCQWRIGLRKKEWRERCHQWCQPYFERLMPPEEKAARDKIEAQTYPLDFHKGLILMGVGGDGPKEREARYWPFYRGQLIFSAQMKHQYGEAMNGGGGTVRSLDDFVEPSESELITWFEGRKAAGWLSATWLLQGRDQWQRYNVEHTKQKRSAAGKRSGEARKPRAKPAKPSKDRK